MRKSAIEKSGGDVGGTLASGLYNEPSATFPRCFVVARDHQAPELLGDADGLCLQQYALYAFTTDRWDLFTVVQSTLHEAWARKYSGSLKQDLRLLALQVL